MIQLFTAVLILTAIVLSGPARSTSAADKPAESSYTDTQYNFSISPPAFPQGAAKTVIPVMFTGPVENQFAPNVNVMVQERQPAKDMYLETTKSSIGKADGKVNESKSLKVGEYDAEQIDYQMPIKGTEGRFLVMTVFVKDRVYVVTCTSLAADFDKHHAEFQKCLDSFSVQ